MIMRRVKNGMKRMARAILPATKPQFFLHNIIEPARRWAYTYPSGPVAGHFSQYGQDTFIAELLRGKQHGTFLDVGAHDGISLSNTYYFEQSLGWTGMCIEPHPEAFQRLIRNRTCVCLNVAVSTEETTQPFMLIKGTAEMLSGLVAGHRSVTRAMELASEQHATAEVHEIACRRLDRLLDEHGLRTVDYISLDIEGSELEILKTIDLNALQVAVICVENNYPDSRIELHLRDFGYRLAGILGRDEIYRKVDSRSFLGM